MTNLYPGMLFYSSGLNKKSTPVRREATPSEIDEKLGRGPFNGRPWPKSSPVSHVYDVRNSSTRMIILNNKLSKNPKGSRLRGQTDRQGEIERPEPFRHTSDDSHTNWQHHKKCGNSVSEKFVPIFPTGMSSAPAWVNKTQRPAMRFDNGSSVNPNHHIQCQGHMDYDIVRWYNTQRRPRSRASSTKESRALSPILNDPGLSRGEKRYLNHIAKIYSVDHMRVQKQVQYNELMWSEIRKGRVRQSDWEKYYKYLNTPRKTQYGQCDPARPGRSISAPGTKRKDAEDDSRPNTTRTGAKHSSRDPSTPGSTNRRGHNSQGPKNRAKTTKKADDLDGKPARVESPLPLMPKRKDSMSSISSSGSDTRKGNDEKRDKVPANQNGQSRAGTEKRASEETKPEDNGNKIRRSSDEKDDKKISKEKYDEVDKRKEEEDDNDERSKISARDNEHHDDGHGRSVTYHPMSNERVEDEERSRINNENGQEGLQEDYKRNNDKKAVTPKIIVEENPAVTLPPTNAKSSSDNKGSSSKGQVNDSDDMDNGPRLVHHVHKEGGDRPLSRLGGRGQFTLVKKDNTVNSDDDYSDDDEETPKKTDEHKGFDEPKGDHSGGKNGTELSKRGGEEPLHQANKPDVKLSLNNNDAVKQKDNDDGDTQPVSPTEASSQEKPSTIATLEY